MAAALGAGLIAGAFFAFSTFVMGALARLPAAQGIAAMQSINVVVINPIFLGVFMGTAALAVALAAVALFQWSLPGTAYLLIGSALYVVGCFLVTMIGNVPLNNALMAVAADNPTSVQVWTKYLADWVWWNHVRTVASLAAAGFFIVALRAAANVS
jgi:uncharacterized membrane protein